MCDIFDSSLNHYETFLVTKKKYILLHTKREKNQVENGPKRY